MTVGLTVILPWQIMRCLAASEASALSLGGLTTSGVQSITPFTLYVCVPYTLSAVNVNSNPSVKHVWDTAIVSGDRLVMNIFQFETCR